jgi:hydrogenase maturation protease
MTPDPPPSREAPLARRETYAGERCEKCAEPIGDHRQHVDPALGVVAPDPEVLMIREQGPGRGSREVHAGPEAVRADPCNVRPHTLVAGVGNIFLGDDGFGCEVARHLSRSEVPAGVRVVDYGIRGMHLAYDLIDGWDLLVLVDALPDRGMPGRLEVLEVRAEHLGAGGLDAHGMAPLAMLSSLEALGGQLPRTVLVGAQVADTGDQIGLSPQVQDAIPGAVGAIQTLLHDPDLSPGRRGARLRSPQHVHSHEEVG